MRVPLLATLAACALLVPQAGAQILIHRTWTVEDGLVQSQVRSIAEDRDGFLWLGTNFGVSRFDGRQFEGFVARDGVPAAPIVALYPSPNGDVYFGSDGEGAAVRRGGRFELLPASSGLAAGRVRAIAGAPGGDVLFARDDHVVRLRRGGAFERVPFPKPLPSGAVLSSLLAARDGSLFLGTWRHGAFVLRNGRLEPLQGGAGLPGSRVNAIREARGGGVWFGSEHGLSLYRDGRFQLRHGVDGPEQDEVLAILEGSDGVLHLGTRASGLVKILPGGAPERIDRERGLLDGELYSLCETRGGTWFFGTNAGLSAYDPGAMRTWRPPGLTKMHGVVWSILEDGRDFWMGTASGLAVLREGGRWERPAGWEAIGGLPVRELRRGPSGRLYLATVAGLWIDDGRERRRLTRRDGLPDDFVRTVHEAPDGDVYIGTSRGLAVLPAGRRKALPVGELADEVVFSIAGTADGAVWIGTERKGLFRIGPDGESRRWTRRDGLLADSVISVRVARDGSLLLGTTRGLSILREGRFQSFDGRNSLAEETVACTLEDQAGRLYLHTGQGIQVLEPGARKLSRRLLREDGLASREALLGACTRDSQGRLWFGTIRGASVYDPRQERPRGPAPRVHITGWSHFGREEMPVAGGEPGSNRINSHTFSYTGIDLAHPGKVVYRHRLVGFEGWSGATDQRQVQYTNLAPGAYRFEVQAAGEGGRWSEAAALPFVIPSPRWWQRPALTLSLSAVTLLMAGAVVSVHRVRQLLAYERLRTRLAADLHDDVGAGLTEIAILSDAHPELARAGETARELVDRMNDIVWLVNPRRDSLRELVVRLKSSYAEMFAQQGIVFRAGDLSSLEAARLSMPCRESLYAILKEALRNALRHSGAGQVRLDAVLRGRRLEVTVRDDGRGFDPPAASGGEGLRNMRRRAESIGGRLEIESAAGRGTLVRFTGPVNGRKT